MRWLVPGLDPTLKLNGVEMINAVQKRYEDDLDLTLAAAELGIQVRQFSATGERDFKRQWKIKR